MNAQIWYSQYGQVATIATNGAELELEHQRAADVVR